MKLPNKLFSYKESTISKLPVVLSEIIENEYVTIYQLYMNVIGKFDNISEFLEVLECLYALGKIDYDNELRRIRYAV